MMSNIKGHHTYQHIQINPIYRYILSSLLILLLGMLVGCSHNLSSSKEVDGASNTKMPITMHTIIDDRGKAVEIPVHPQHVLSLTSAYEPILLELIGPNRMAGVSYLSKRDNYSPTVKLASQVKTSLYSYSSEKIFSLKPDVVLAPEYTSKDVMDSLELLHIPVVMVNSSKSVADTLRLIDQVAHIVGEESKGKTMVQTTQADIAHVEALAKEVGQEETVLCVSTMDGYAGAGSLFDDMCQYMHVNNGPSKLGYPPRTPFTEERIIAMNPNVILVPVYSKSEMAWQSMYAHNPALSTVSAVQEGRVVTMPAMYLYTSNQYIGKSMLGIMKIMYPSLRGD